MQLQKNVREAEKLAKAKVALRNCLYYALSGRAAGDLIQSALIGTYRPGGIGSDIFTINPQYWQSDFPYLSAFDNIFSFASWISGGHSAAKTTTVDIEGNKYRIWMWQGYYPTLGQGIEMGIYLETLPGIWAPLKNIEIDTEVKLINANTPEVERMVDTLV